ncbi:MAG TPA: CAP domain-containing protein [Patescibacteria group bacterium]|nr:CAP domain-containing protein [Patescibacteria group bacterium]
MIKNIKMALGLLCLAALAAAVPQPALAFKLEMTNNQAQVMNFAMVSLDDATQKWSCSGWYSVPAGSSKTFNFSKSNGGKHFYLHAKAGDQILCGGDATPHITRTVISNSFQYYDRQQCPEGSNRRVVTFYKIDINENAADVSWGEAEKPRSQGVDITQAESTAIDLLNRDRAKNGLAALAPDSRLTQVARKHAADMMARGYFSHTNLQGQSPFDRLKANGITFRLAGENIGDNRSVEKLESAWMESPGHRANILNSGYTHVGVGLAAKADGSLYGVQLFASY